MLIPHQQMEPDTSIVSLLPVWTVDSRIFGHLEVEWEQLWSVQLYLMTLESYSVPVPRY